MIVLVIITIILLLTLIVGHLTENDLCSFIGFSGLLSHGILGWLVLGNIVPTSEATSFYDINSVELRHFSYGSDICFYVVDEEKDITFLLKNFKDNEIFNQGDWLLAVTKKYSSYSKRIYVECEILSKTDNFEYKIVPKSEKKE